MLTKLKTNKKLKIVMNLTAFIIDTPINLYFTSGRNLSPLILHNSEKLLSFISWLKCPVISV
ncbi:MAG: hypothetical protein ABWZ66_03375, partial [Pyrinomonadaceae bacterium]